MARMKYFNSLGFQIKDSDQEKEFVSACGRGDVEVVDKLVDNTDINCWRGEGLMAAIVADHEDVYSRLLSRPNLRPNVQDRAGFTALHWALCADRPRAVVALLARKDIQVNVRNLDGNTPLMAGVKCGSVEGVKVALWDERIDVDGKDEMGRGLEEAIGAAWMANDWGNEKIREIIRKKKKIDMGVECKPAAPASG